MKPAPRSITREISGIIDTTDRRIQVILSTGETVWLPRSVVDIMPGLVVMPEWLANRIFCGGKNHGRSSMPGRDQNGSRGSALSKADR